MTIIRVGKDRRITLPKDLIEQYGRKFEAIKIGSDILLKPVVASKKGTK